MIIMIRISKMSMQLLLRFRFLGSLTCWKFQSEQYYKLRMSFNTCYEHLSCIIYLHYLSSCEELLTVKITDQACATLMKLKFIMHVLRIDDDLYGHQKKDNLLSLFPKKDILASDLLKKIAWFSDRRKKDGLTQNNPGPPKIKRSVP